MTQVPNVSSPHQTVYILHLHVRGGADHEGVVLSWACGFTVTRNPSEMAKLLKGLL